MCRSLMTLSKEKGLDYNGETGFLSLGNDVNIEMRPVSSLFLLIGNFL